MKLKKTAFFLSILITGIAIGFFTRNITDKMSTGKKESNFVVLREGQSKLTNPLLACDVASDVLNDPKLISFKKEVEQYLDSRMGKDGSAKVSVYFRELNDGLWFSIGETDKFVPASLRKVPLMIALLKMAETEKNLLERKVKFDLTTDDNLKQNFKPSQTLVSGKQYTIRDLIYRMIVYSDNNAFTLLTRAVDPNELGKVYSSLRILDPLNPVSDQFLSVQTYESFFRVLYNSSYLSREASDWALQIMSNSEFKTGLVAGVPSTVTVSHKFGEHSDPNGAQLHDCGIVYYPKHPYLLCIMSQGPNFEMLDDVIAGVSRVIYSEIDAQSQKQ